MRKNGKRKNTPTTYLDRADPRLWWTDGNGNEDPVQRGAIDIAGIADALGISKKEARFQISGLF